MQTLQQKWEYSSDHQDSYDQLQETLVQRGENGWELVNVVGFVPQTSPTSAKTLRARQSHWYAFFKRPLC